MYKVMEWEEWPSTVKNGYRNQLHLMLEIIILYLPIPITDKFSGKQNSYILLSISSVWWAFQFLAWKLEKILRPHSHPNKRKSEIADAFFINQTVGT